MADTVLAQLSQVFSKMYSGIGRRSIPPEKLLRALLLQVLYTVRSERMLMEQLEYNLLFRWFVGLNMDEGCGSHSGQIFENLIEQAVEGCPKRGRGDAQNGD
jgi:transposase